MFSEILQNIVWDETAQKIYSCSREDVKQALNRTSLTQEDIACLLSPAADPFLEDMARKSCSITRMRFGNTIQMYTPIYISNFCTNACVYCGFNVQNKTPRKTLSHEEIVKEFTHIYNMGFRHIIILTGEDRNAVSPEKLAEISKKMHSRFSSLTIEVYPMSIDEYRLLMDSGIDGLTVYQETYNREVYGDLHPSGRKRDFTWRLDTPDRGAVAGMRKLGIGALLGFTDWRVESYFTLLHAMYLTKKYWKSHVQISFPRLREAEGSYKPHCIVSDRDLTHLICAARILLNDAGIVLSTREPMDLRNNLAPLGVTSMSSGSKTDPGGHTGSTKESKQFEIMDPREPWELSEYLKTIGLEPVWKDWDREFIL